MILHGEKFALSGQRTCRAVRAGTETSSPPIQKTIRRRARGEAPVHPLTTYTVKRRRTRGEVGKNVFTVITQHPLQLQLPLNLYSYVSAFRTLSLAVWAQTTVIVVPRACPTAPHPHRASFGGAFAIADEFQV